MKIMTKREQTAVYEFMESVGGMFHILEILCEFFDGYFSETFVVASLASRLLILKKHEPESGGNKHIERRAKKRRMRIIQMCLTTT